MARNKLGYLGQVSGTMGNLVAYQAKDGTHIRKRPEFRRNRVLSEAQLLHQAKFKEAGKFYRNIKELVTQTFEGVTGNSIRNTAVGNMLTQAVEGNMPDLFINYSEVLMATGTLKKATAPTAESTQPGILKFNWQSNDVGGTRANDKAILVAYCPELEDIWYTLAGPTRSTREGQLEMPFFSGKEVHTWISFVSPNGQLIADSVYTGAILIA